MNPSKAVDSATRRRNLRLGAVLAALVAALILLALLHVSPESATGHESLLTK